MDKKIDKKIEEIRDVLKLDGGDLEIIKYDKKKNLLQIKLLGMCQGCPMAEITVKNFIEKELQKIISGLIVEKVQ
jgi:Fe-S cluster biogenesis protein NfuA